MNPFAIRTELLNISKDYLQKQYDIHLTTAKAAFDQAVLAGQLTATDWEKHIPEYFKFEDIIKKAQELYKFVNETR